MFVWPQHAFPPPDTVTLLALLSYLARRVNKVSPLTILRACVRVCSWPFAESWKKEGKRRRGEEKGREEKECARHSHLPGRITRFRCCVRMSGTGGPCERALSFLPPDSEILPLLLYLFAFPPPPFFLFSFFDTAVALNAGERRRGLPRKGQLLARIGEKNEATDRTDATPLSFCRCMHGLMRLGRRKVAEMLEKWCTMEVYLTK